MVGNFHTGNGDSSFRNKVGTTVSHVRNEGEYRIFFMVFNLNDGESLRGLH